MLLGEYAVLYGQPALVCALDKRITLTLTPRQDEKIILHSEVSGEYTTTLMQLAQLTPTKPFHFVLGALQHYQAKLKRGCDINITSDFSAQMGLGSSAAVTVAAMAAMVTWLNIRMTPFDLLRQARMVVRQMQHGVGSGADVAASVYGGIVAYQAQPLKAEKLANIAPITALYAGYKTQTLDAIKQVQQRFTAYPDIFKQLQQTIGQCAYDGVQCVRQADWKKLGEIMTIQQGLMETLGVSNALLREMIADLKMQPTIFAAKISGSGLGDCVIGLGDVATNYLFHKNDDHQVQRVPVMMTMQGVHCEKI